MMKKKEKFFFHRKMKNHRMGERKTKFILLHFFLGIKTWGSSRLITHSYFLICHWCFTYIFNFVPQMDTINQKYAMRACVNMNFKVPTDIYMSWILLIWNPFQVSRSHKRHRDFPQRIFTYQSISLRLLLLLPYSFPSFATEKEKSQ